MARPERNNVDYFPFYCEDGKKMFYLEETYGNDGFATFVKILRELAKTDYHYLNLSRNTTMMFLSAKCKITKETLESIINDLVDLEKFNRILWEENQIIWCQDFIDSIQDAYNKRKGNCINYHGLIELLISLGIRKQSKSNLKGVIKPQRKEEEIKEDNNKIKESDIIGSLKPSLMPFFFNWLDYRRQMKKPIKVEKTLISLVNKFNKYNDDCCEWVVNHSIENGYQGLFWDKYTEQKKTSNKPRFNSPLI